jgi:peptidyl-dipeptidase A
MGYDLTKLLGRRWTRKLVGTAKAFSNRSASLPCPRPSGNASQFVKPKDRDVVCHASAWDIDWKDDLR